MKKQILILAAAGLGVFGIASCGGGTTTPELTQTQLDSISKAQADSMALAQQAYNDSVLAQQAIDSVAKADSLAAINGVTTGTTTKTTTTVKKPTTTKPTNHNNNTPTPAPTRTQAEKEADKKASKFGDAAAKARVDADNANKKAAKFGDAAAKAKVEAEATDKKASKFK